MKYALIGCGRISKNHIIAARYNQLEIAAICDINAFRMQTLLNEHKLEGDVSIQCYEDYHKMLEENQLDLVSIATESGLHAQIALDCIKHGVNVIIEKPIAMSIKDANKIISEARIHCVKVSACHQNRFNIAVQKTRAAVENGRFGKLSHGSINVRWNRGQSYYNQALWRGTWAQDGGCLMNQCIHGIDLLRWMLGREIDEVYGVTKQQFHDYLEAEDIGMALVKFSAGAIGSIEGTVNVYPKNLEETLYLMGENGTVKIGGTSTNNIDVWQFKDAPSQDECLREETSNVYGNGHSRLFADMIQAIQTDREPYVNAVAGRDALELVLAIYLSSSQGKPVKLPLDECSTLDFIGQFK